MFRLPLLPSKQEMRGQVFEIHFIHLCPGVNEWLWHSILTKVLLRDPDKGRTKHMQGHVLKAPKNGNVVWFSTYAHDTQEAGGISWVSFEIYGILGVRGE